MRRSKSAIFIVAAAVILSGAGYCLLQAGSFEEAPVTFDPPYPEVNADGEPILAVFEGRIPGKAFDCEKLKLVIVLYQNRETKAASTYWLGYVGVGNGSNDRIVSQGVVTTRHGVQGYPEAVVYELDSATHPELRFYWRVNEDIVLPVDENMSPKVGNAAWGTMLSRYAEPYGPRTYN
jgi:hypothetical protein